MDEVCDTGVELLIHSQLWNLNNMCCGLDGGSRRLIGGTNREGVTLD